MCADTRGLWGLQPGRQTTRGRRGRSGSPSGCGAADRGREAGRGAGSESLLGGLGPPEMLVGSWLGVQIWRREGRC